MVFLCERAITHAPILCISVEPWQQEGEMPLPVEEWVEGAVVTVSLLDYACVFCAYVCEFTLRFHVSFLLLVPLVYWVI